MNTKELQFAYLVKHALEENSQKLPDETIARLSFARKIAVSRKKKRHLLPIHAVHNILAGPTGNFFNAPLTLLGRLGIAAPLLAGALILIGLYEFEHEQRITEMAEFDVAVLSDELPLSAYADQGFNAYLARRDE